MVVMLFLSSISASSMTITGEHINGAPYLKYSGPTEVEKMILDELYSSLLSYSRSANKKRLMNLLRSANTNNWENLGLEFISLNRETGRIDEILVGLKMKKGFLYVTIYENLVIAAFEDEIGTHYYFLENQKPYKVTDTYIFPSAIESPDDGGLSTKEDS